MTQMLHFMIWGTASFTFCVIICTKDEAVDGACYMEAENTKSLLHLVL